MWEFLTNVGHHYGPIDTPQKSQNVRVNPIQHRPFLHRTQDQPKPIWMWYVVEKELRHANPIGASHFGFVFHPRQERILDCKFFHHFGCCVFALFGPLSLCYSISTARCSHVFRSICIRESEKTLRESLKAHKLFNVGLRSGPTKKHVKMNIVDFELDDRSESGRNWVDMANRSLIAHHFDEACEKVLAGAKWRAQRKKVHVRIRPVRTQSIASKGNESHYSYKTMERGTKREEVKVREVFRLSLLHKVISLFGRSNSNLCVSCTYLELSAMHWDSSRSKMPSDKELSPIASTPVFWPIRFVEEHRWIPSLFSCGHSWDDSILAKTTRVREDRRSAPWKFDRRFWRGVFC